MVRATTDGPRFGFAIARRSFAAAGISVPALAQNARTGHPLYRSCRQFQSVGHPPRVEPWTAHYDEYSRIVARTDYNAGNIAQGIPEVHYHVYRWGVGEIAREIAKHVPGEYFP